MFPPVPPFLRERDGLDFETLVVNSRREKSPPQGRRTSLRKLVLDRRSAFIDVRRPGRGPARLGAGFGAMYRSNRPKRGPGRPEPAGLGRPSSLRAVP
jgi:hypothetical protein